LILAFLGGTGPEGTGLATRLAMAGHEIAIGSRSAERADEAAAAVREASGSAGVRGYVNEEAASAADIVINTVPHTAQPDLLPGLASAIGSKILISTVVPMLFEKGVGASAVRVPEGSAAEQAQSLLPEARVVGAFQNLSASNLGDTSHQMDADVLVTGDDAEAKAEVSQLVEQINGLRAIDAGRLANTQYVEHITVLCVAINRRYKVHSEIKIAGLDGLHA
jgi:8-hydroxy-5-deazaflavin:NADPH oxidoreductase